MKVSTWVPVEKKRTVDGVETVDRFRRPKTATVFHVSQTDAVKPNGKARRRIDARIDARQAAVNPGTIHGDQDDPDPNGPRPLTKAEHAANQREYDRANADYRGESLADLMGDNDGW